MHVVLWCYRIHNRIRTHVGRTCIVGLPKQTPIVFGSLDYYTFRIIKHHERDGPNQGTMLQHDLGSNPRVEHKHL